ncbi:RICIN domain-containing protein [Streptomyces sp. NPDC002992]|uniref:RICIN domain-containing protein n=1 Tax=Streptomyces sp. NPDC002992 TaxID=3154273 RepID=UPI0033B45333
MKRILMAGIAMAALFFSSLIALAPSASAVGTSPFMIRHQGTALCLRGVIDQLSAWNEVKAVLCDTNDPRQRWGNMDLGGGPQFFLANDNGGSSGLCLTSTPNGSIYTTACSTSGSNWRVATMDTDSATPMASGNFPCYLGAGSNGSVICSTVFSPEDRKWIFTYQAGAGGPFTYRNANSGKCLEIGGWGTGNGASANQWDCFNGNNNQRWVQGFRAQASRS